VRRLVETFVEHRPACVIALEEVPRESVSQYGIVKPAHDGEFFPILDLIEKPEPAEAPSRLAIAARYVFSPSIHQALERTLPDKKGEVQLTDAIRLLLNDGEKVMGLRLSPREHRYDIGNFESYFEAFLDFALTDPQLGPRLRQSLKERLREDRP